MKSMISVIILSPMITLRGNCIMCVDWFNALLKYK